MSASPSRIRTLRDLALPNATSLDARVLAMDLWELDRCRFFGYSHRAGDGSRASIEMCFAGVGDVSVHLVLLDVTSVVLPDLQPAFCVPELEIRNVKDAGWEGLSFVLEAGGDPVTTRIYCGGIRVVDHPPACEDD